MLHAQRWFDKPVGIDATLLGAAELSGLVARAGLTVHELTSRPPYEAEAPTERLYLWAVRP